MTVPRQQLLDTIETLADFLAEAHAEDKAADHYGDDRCSYCEAIDKARALLSAETTTPSVGD